MLSVLIPAYNFDTSAMVEELQRQTKTVSQAVEIIIIDDNSSKYVAENQASAQKYNLYYLYLSTNIGRSKIRNLLASKANYTYLLFLDGDVFPYSQNFLSNYISSIKSTTQVIYGGRKHLYAEENLKKLRWKYGYYKEDKSSEERKKHPYVSVISNNLLVQKKVFDEIKFDESLSTYGCEDTLFGFELKVNKINVQHIDNPVIHKDIDSNDVYLSKTKDAIKNLVLLENSNRFPKNFRPIQRLYLKLKKLYLIPLSSWIFIQFGNSIEKQLLKENSSLFLFNIYRMLYYCHLKLKPKKNG